MITLLEHTVRANPGISNVTTVSLYFDPALASQPYMVHTSVNGGETNTGALFRRSRDAAAAWLDAITKAEKGARP